MTPEDELELQKFRDEQPSKLKQARRIALTIGILTIIALEGFAYAYFQHTAFNEDAARYQLQLMEREAALKAAAQNAVKFETLAGENAELLRNISDECQRKRRAQDER